MIREGTESLIGIWGGMDMRKHSSFSRGVGRVGFLANSCGRHVFTGLQVFVIVQVLNV
jgi:hypothetical protein